MELARGIQPSGCPACAGAIRVSAYATHIEAYCLSCAWRGSRAREQGVPAPETDAGAGGKQKQCDWCWGKYPDNPKQPRQRFCSRKCGRAQHTYDALQRRKRKWPKRRRCRVCKGTMYAQRPTRMYCGDRCNDAAKRARNKAETGYAKRVKQVYVRRGNAKPRRVSDGV